MDAIDQLLELLRDHAAGATDRGTAFGKTVFSGLVDVWPDLAGSDNHSTSADKLYRAENLSWSPPLLTFRLERHGGTVNGSSRADLHFWEVDLEKCSARVARQSYRQLERSAKRLDCVALARDVESSIRNGHENAALIWDDGKQTVTIKLGVVIPETMKMTTSARRGRFRSALIRLMSEAGWEEAPKGNLLRFSRITNC